MYYERGKYITGIMKDIHVAVVFPDVVQHSCMSKLFKEINGAGFFNVVKKESSPTGLAAQCFGKSVGLSVEADIETDSILVSRALGLENLALTL